uniref:Deoxynucleotidyltransferase terminal-interacting protein 1 n=1 Tax=Coturnix japonica TaxID=93934 RepID=A0A8C2T172_COTJA
MSAYSNELSGKLNPTGPGSSQPHGGAARGGGWRPGGAGSGQGSPGTGQGSPRRTHPPEAAATSVAPRVSRSDDVLNPVLPEAAPRARSAMGAARDAEQQPGPPGEEGPGGGEEQPGGTVRGEGGGGGGEGGREGGGLGADGCVPQSPWNIMIKHRQVQRRGRRSQMTTSFTDPIVSMDLLRAVLQPSINEEIRAVFNKYMKFFQKAALNVRDNVGEDVDPEQLIQETCRSCLEQAKLLFSDGKKVVSRLPHEQMGPKRKGRPPGQSLSNDRGVSGMSAWKLKVSEPVRRDGPKWDPSRLTETTTFVLGSRANKALGMGGTRGRLYIKHPHLFKVRYHSRMPPPLGFVQKQFVMGTGCVRFDSLGFSSPRPICCLRARTHNLASTLKHVNGSTASQVLVLPRVRVLFESRAGRAKPSLWEPPAPCCGGEVLAAEHWNGLCPAGGWSRWEVCVPCSARSLLLYCSTQPTRRISNGWQSSST